MRAGRGKNLPRSRGGVGGGLKATETLWREALRHDIFWANMTLSCPGVILESGGGG